MLCSKGSQDKLEKINESALRHGYFDYSFFYEELLANSKESTFHITSSRVLAFEVYKTHNNLNPILMTDFLLQKSPSHYLRIQNPLLIPRVTTTTYGIKSQIFQGPKKWNSLSDEI